MTPSFRCYRGARGYLPSSVLHACRVGSRRDPGGLVLGCRHRGDNLTAGATVISTSGGSPTASSWDVLTSFRPLPARPLPLFRPVRGRQLRAQLWEPSDNARQIQPSICSGGGLSAADLTFLTLGTLLIGWCQDCVGGVSAISALLSPWRSCA